MLLFLILAIVLISAVIRLITLPFRLGRYRRGFYGNPYYGGGYGYGCGYRRHRGFGHVLLVILVLVLLSHLFGHHHHVL
jgi:hypothetical protein